MNNRRKISLQTIEEDIVHAIVKARGDVNAIVHEAGYTPLVFGSRSPIGLWRVFMRHFNILSLRWKIRKSDTVFVQFPWIHKNKKDFYDNLFGSKATVNCIVHDLDSFRYMDHPEEHADELEQLNRCHSIIAHTPAMKDYLVERGVDKDKIKLLYLFPYLTEDPVHSLTATDKPVVIFAGNLAKSPFVSHLADIAGPNLAFNLYGKGLDSFTESEHVQYKGVFSPDHPGSIEGNWGLVWDGDQLETCNGTYGKYLRYNSSHKISLYLSLGIPVVLWKESSLRHFVEEHQIGIAVDSLYDLAKTLESMPAEKVAAIQEHTRQYARKIRSGERLRELLGEMSDN